MYSFTEGDRVWVQATWNHEESRMGAVTGVSPNGTATITFGQWSMILMKSDGFSIGGAFRIDRHIPKEELDLTRRI